MKQDKADEFAKLWEILSNNAPAPEREYRFCDRLYRFDFAWPIVKLAVEIDGGNHQVRYSNRMGRYVAIGRHVQESDAEKCNLAIELGWSILHYTPAMLRKAPTQCVEQVCAALLIRARE